MEWLNAGNAQEQGINGLSDVQRVGHRVVHGADLFEAPTRIDDQVTRKIEELSDLAPLHNAAALEVIRALAERVEAETPMVAVFDTLFHRTIPEVAARYALPPEMSSKYKIRRYGFHGVSHHYMVLRYAQITGQRPEDTNLVTLHLC